MLNRTGNTYRNVKVQGQRSYQFDRPACHSVRKPASTAARDAPTGRTQFVSYFFQHRRSYRHSAIPRPPEIINFEAAARSGRSDLASLFAQRSWKICRCHPAALSMLSTLQQNRLQKLATGSKAGTTYGDDFLMLSLKTLTVATALPA